LLVCAIDGTTLTVPDSPRMLTRFTKQRGNHGGTGYPQIRLVALLACGTRTVIDAVFGATTTGETGYAPRLLPSLKAGMILLTDRNFGARDLIGDIAATGDADPQSPGQFRSNMGDSLPHAPKIFSWATTRTT
jgi:hypothetical protein